MGKNLDPSDGHPPAVIPPVMTGRRAGFPDQAERSRFLDSTIISVSGWRRVFAADRDPESRDGRIDMAGALFAASAAAAFLRFLCRRGTRSARPAVALALDTRPTGPAIAGAMIGSLLAGGAQVRFLSVAPTPEAMAYTRGARSLDGLIYVSASHNPLGHNGIKFSAGDGGVLPGEDNSLVRDMALELFLDDRKLWELWRRIEALPPGAFEAVRGRSSAEKAESLRLYRNFLDRVITGRWKNREKSLVLEELRQALKKRPIGVLAELNGSARTCSVDEEYLRELGVRVRVVNGEPGGIAHAILPEGEALLPACRALEEAAAQDGCFELGYVPDNDGDRGNVVLLGDDGRARPLEAQEVFALSVAAELSFAAASGLVRYDKTGKPRPPLAVVVNGPTSGRIEQVAGWFGARVFRAEVGEANVLDLAARVRRKGYLVRILGEGSNGGNITHPSQVRDPLGTVMAFVKLARLGSVRQVWRTRSGMGDSLPGTGARLHQMISALPSYSSTPSYEERAVFQIKTRDQASLKLAYERILSSRWPELAGKLEKRLGVTGYRVIYYEGPSARPADGEKPASRKGGFKVSLRDPGDREKAFLWMRPSGTEPVFRIMADVAGNSADEKYLLGLHRDILRRADSECAG